MSLVVVSILLFYLLFTDEKIDSNQYEKLDIRHIQIKGQTIFLKTAYWGVSADKMAIIISRNNSQIVNDKDDMIFNGIVGDNLYFVKNDTLNLIINTVHQKRQNKSFQSIIKIDSSNSKETDIYYSLFDSNKMLNDSIRVFKF